MNEPDKDLLIENVKIIDGAGAKAFEGEIVISGEKILSVHKKKEKTPLFCERLDGEGLYLAPGFIDTHTHSDMSLFASPQAVSSITQGVTTLVTGNCGLSPFPVMTEEVREHLNILYEKYDEKISWKDFARYAELLQAKEPFVNILPLCGHNTLKANIYGYQQKKDTPYLRMELAALLENTLLQGAGGLSTGLLYMPGKTSSREELTLLMQCLKKFDRLYTTHLRSEGADLLQALEEAVFLIAKGSGKGHISHLKTAGSSSWHKLPQVFQILEEAQKKGLQITCDRYPYTYSATSLSTVLPSEYDTMTDRAIRERLKHDPLLCQNLAERLNASSRNWDEVLLADTCIKAMQHFRGKSIAYTAKALSQTPGEVIIHILAEDSPNAMGAFAGMSRENLEKILQKDFVCCGSDETSRPQEDLLGRSHPRGFGSFPCFFRLLRSLGFSVEEAVARMTALPAKIFSLSKRGLLRQGFYADMVLFDPEKFSSKADFSAPHTLSEGIRGVFVNGRYILLEGQSTFSGRGSGKVLKKL